MREEYNQYNSDFDQKEFERRRSKELKKARQATQILNRFY